jgi:cytochrome b pre-mRNA-processing protein 3
VPSRQGKLDVLAASLYHSIVAQARLPVFYANWSVPDTIEGRFEMIALHCALVLRRLRQGDRAAERLQQPLLEFMFADLDRSIREIGVGDMSVGKYMKRLGKSFYGRATVYDQALDAGDQAALAAAVLRNILATSDSENAVIERAAPLIAAYVQDCDKALHAQGDDAIAAGMISFPALKLEQAA